MLSSVSSSSSSSPSSFISHYLTETSRKGEKNENLKEKMTFHTPRNDEMHVFHTSRREKRGLNDRQEESNIF